MKSSKLKTTNKQTKTKKQLLIDIPEKKDKGPTGPLGKWQDFNPEAQEQNL